MVKNRVKVLKSLYSVGGLQGVHVTKRVHLILIFFEYYQLK